MTGAKLTMDTTSSSCGIESLIAISKMPHLYNLARAFLEKIPWQAQIKMPFASFFNNSFDAAIIVPPVSMISSIIKQYFPATGSPLILVMTALLASGRYLFKTAIGISPNA